MALILFTDASVAQNPPPPDIEALIERTLVEAGIPGVAVAIVGGDSAFWSGGYGVREQGSGLTVDSRTRFAVGSLTKAMTAAALGMLVDEGRLGWDDPLRDHIPQFRLEDPWVTEHLTIRDALAMRSGITRGDTLVFLSGRSRPEIFDRLPRLSAPEFRTTYGAAPNLMYMLAGEVVTAVSGVGWDHFVEDRIFRPIGMIRATASPQTAGSDTNAAKGHVRQSAGFDVVGFPDFANIRGAAAVLASAEDIGRWLQFQLLNGTVEGRQLVSGKSLKEMRRPQNILTPSYQALFNPEGLLNAYGFGWVLSDYRGGTLIEHAGAAPGFCSLIAFIPEHGVGVALLSNLGMTEAIGPLKTLKFRIVERLVMADSATTTEETPLRQSPADGPSLNNRLD